MRQGWHVEGFPEGFLEGSVEGRAGRAGRSGPPGRSGGVEVQSLAHGLPHANHRRGVTRRWGVSGLRWGQCGPQRLWTVGCGASKQGLRQGLAQQASCRSAAMAPHATSWPQRGGSGEGAGHGDPTVVLGDLGW